MAPNLERLWCLLWLAWSRLFRATQSQFATFAASTFLLAPFGSRVLASAQQGRHKALKATLCWRTAAWWLQPCCGHRQRCQWCSSPLSHQGQDQAKGPVAMQMATKSLTAIAFACWLWTNPWLLQKSWSHAEGRRNSSLNSSAPWRPWRMGSPVVSKLQTWQTHWHNHLLPASH